jgi:hypothetical protein
MCLHGIGELLEKVLGHKEIHIACYVYIYIYIYIYRV